MLCGCVVRCGVVRCGVVGWLAVNVSDVVWCGLVFESLAAQMVEHPTQNRKVAGSIPAARASCAARGGRIRLAVQSLLHNVEWPLRDLSLVEQTWKG